MRWLSAALAMNRLFLLRKQVEAVIVEKIRMSRPDEGKKAKKILDIMTHPHFWIQVAYMADVFSIFNKYCKEMQGNNVDLGSVSKL